MLKVPIPPPPKDGGAESESASPYAHHGDGCASEKMHARANRNRRHSFSYRNGGWDDEFADCDHCPIGTFQSNGGIADDRLCDYPDVRDMFDPNKVTSAEGDGWLRPMMRFHMVMRPDGSYPPGLSTTGPLERHMDYLNKALKPGKIEFQKPDAVGLTLYKRGPLHLARVMFGDDDEIDGDTTDNKGGRMACGPWTESDGNKYQTVKDQTGNYLDEDWVNVHKGVNEGKINRDNIRAGDTIEYEAQITQATDPDNHGNLMAMLCAVKGYDPTTGKYDAARVGCQDLDQTDFDHTSHKQTVLAQYAGDYSLYLRSSSNQLNVEYKLSITKENCYKDDSTFFKEFVAGKGK